MTQPSGLTYEIRTFADMLKVPADRRGEMLIDLHTWLALAEDMMADPDVPKFFKVNVETFHWCDDGKRELGSVVFHDIETGERLGEIKLPEGE